MAQARSELWHTLRRTPGTRTEYKFDIAGTEYGPEYEVSHSVDSGLYEEFGIGNAACATLKMSLFAPDIPRAATIRRYVRLVNGEQATDWYPHGVFYTNRRAEDDGYWEIEAFDAMRRGDVVWTPDQSLSFPMTMPAAVNIFCSLMGVPLDPRTSLNSAYTIDYPANDWTIRDELRFIAAAHGGNWMITADEKLYLVPLGEEPEETSLLCDEHGDYIVIGGVRLIV